LHSGLQLPDLFFLLGHLKMAALVFLVHSSNTDGYRHTLDVALEASAS
jgi:hypothetical protein